MKKFVSMFKKFARESKGSTSIAFGFAAIPMMVAVGVAIDYERLTSAKSDLQQSSDAVALDAANSYAGGNVNLVARATEFLKLNPPKGIDPANVIVAAAILPGNEKVKITLKADLPLVFGGIIGEDGDATVNSESITTLPVFSDYHKGEIALVLDYSGSMNDYVGGVRKYLSMRQEVTSLINSLSQSGANNDVKFGVVPFSAAVRLTLPRNYYYGQTGTSSSTRCIEDRKYPYNLSADTPTGVDQYNVTKFRESANVSCSDYGSVGIRDLSFGHAANITAINSMGPIGNTHITLGTEMAYHMLTPNAPYTQGVPMHQADTLKAVVIMTDGMQTSGGNGPSNSYSVANAESNLASLCTTMKAAGIRVFTVSFDLSDTAAGASASENRLKVCSGPSSDDPVRTPAEIAAKPYPFYYNTETNADLAAAFGSIRNQIARNMFLSQ